MYKQKNIQEEEEAIFTFTWHQSGRMLENRRGLKETAKMIDGLENMIYSKRCKEL